MWSCVVEFQEQKTGKVNKPVRQERDQKNFDLMIFLHNIINVRLESLTMCKATFITQFNLNLNNKLNIKAGLVLNPSIQIPEFFGKRIYSEKK